MRSLKLTSIEEAILLCMLKKPRYGQEIVTFLSEVSEGQYQVNCGSLYPALNRLKKIGFLKDTLLEEDLEIRKGNKKRYYQLTSLGKDALKRCEEIRHKIKNECSIKTQNYI